jgi:hypothetical protein
MLQTNPVADTTQSKGRADKISELALAIQIGGIKNDVIMDVLSINMCADNKRVPTLRKSQRQLLPDAVCLFGSDLAGKKGLPVW